MKEMSEEEMLKVEGITPQILVLLKNNNIRTVETLAIQKKDILVNIGISENVAEKILENAWKKLGYTWKSADKLLEDRTSIQKFTTGCKRLDELINGGFEAGTLNEIAGEYGAGKTQTLFTTLVENLANHPEYSAIFMDTEETFVPERVKEIAESRGYNGEDILKRTILARVLSSEHYEFLVKKSDNIIKSKNVKLFFVDSLIAPLRAEFVGRETLAERQQTLNRILRKLLNYAKLFGLAVVFTNQVVQSPVPHFGFDPTQQLVPTGGSILAHNATLRLFLRRTQEPTIRIARVFDSPCLPPREIPIRITEKGIE